MTPGEFIPWPTRIRPSAPSQPSAGCPPPPFPHWLRAVTKGLIPKQGFSNGSVIYLCSSPTWEEQASGQYCSYCLTHLSPPFGPSLLSARPPHIMSVYRLSLLHTPRGSAACFTLHYFRYHSLISCVCDSLRRVGAPQSNTSFYHVSILALRQWPLIPYRKHLLPSMPRVRPLCLKIESSRAHLHLKYGPLLQNFSLEWVNITHSSLGADCADLASQESWRMRTIPDYTGLAEPCAKMLDQTMRKMKGHRCSLCPHIINTQRVES